MNLRRRPCWRCGSKAQLFDPKSTGAAAWIFTIARNLRIDALRRERRSGYGNAIEIDLEFHIDDGPQPDAGLAGCANEMSGFADALLSLSEDQLRVIELSFFEEKVHAEIARTLRYPARDGQITTAAGDESTARAAG